MVEKTRLTQLVSSGGCAAKLDPEMLNDIIRKLPAPKNENILDDFKNLGDCGIYKISPEMAIVQTLDFFPPMVDDPRDFGAIAAANALSDIYACGARAVTALNILCFPDKKLPQTIVENIMLGAIDKLDEAGAVLLGGHSIKDFSLKFGLSVTGIIPLADIVTNADARVGDRLILTKPIGVGLVNTAVKANFAVPDGLVAAARESMMQLNHRGAALLKKYEVHACTDITGFGLVGHAYEMAKASAVTLRIDSRAVPVLGGISNELLNEVKCGGATRNENFYRKWARIADDCAMHNHLLFDPQTSGGLFLAVPAARAEAMVAELIQNGYRHTAIVGDVVEKADFDLDIR